MLLPEIRRVALMSMSAEVFGGGMRHSKKLFTRSPGLVSHQSRCVALCLVPYLMTILVQLTLEVKQGTMEWVSLDDFLYSQETFSE